MGPYWTAEIVVTCCVGLFLSAPAVGHGEGDHAHAEVGRPAPDFTLTDPDGKTYKLSEAKGKIVVLEWTNFTCPFVQRHQRDDKTMVKTWEAFKGDGVVWLAIDSTRIDHGDGHTAEKIRKWAESADVKVPYPILRDESGEVGLIYGAQTTPHMFVIDKGGVLVYAGAIDDDPRGQKEHRTNYVEAAIQSVLSGSTVEIASTKPYGCSVKYAER